MTNVQEGNANTDKTDSAHSQKAHYTKSDAKCRDQRTQYRANWKGVMEMAPWDIKNKTKHNKKTTKLGPRHFPLHQWKFAGKEERRGEKEIC